MTIDIKLNGQPIASASLNNLSSLAEVSDYRVIWDQKAYAALGIEGAQGIAKVTGHRRSHGAWALAARAVVSILAQMADGQVKK